MYFVLADGQKKLIKNRFLKTSDLEKKLFFKNILNTNFKKLQKKYTQNFNGIWVYF